MAPRRGRNLDELLARKNDWTLAAFAGASDATSMQRMLNAARWDTDGVRDDVRRWVAHCFGDWRRGILVVDEVRLSKVGSHSVGVHRQCAPGSLRAGNAQGALLRVAAWKRARGPGVVPAGGLAHGPGPGPGTWLEKRTQPYVLPTAAGTVIARRDGTRVEADRLAEAAPPSAWVRVDPGAAMPGADERWALVALPHGRAATGAGGHPRWARGLLLRRSSAPRVGPTVFQCRFPAECV